MSHRRFTGGTGFDEKCGKYITYSSCSEEKDGWLNSQERFLKYAAANVCIVTPVYDYVKVYNVGEGNKGCRFIFTNILRILAEI